MYAGEHFDTDSQNYYLRARWYDSLSGRFNRMDPYAGNNQDPQSLHKYLYCHTNPVNGIDPSGKMILIGGKLGLVLSIVSWTTVAVLGALAIHSVVTGRSRALKFPAKVFGPSKIRKYLSDHLSEIEVAKTYEEADLHTIFEEYARLYPQVTSRACLAAAENLEQRLKTSLNDAGMSESRKGIIFAPAALFFSVRETGQDALEPDNIIILLPEKYKTNHYALSNPNWYDSEDKKKILFFYPGSVPLRPVGNLYEAIVNDSWGTDKITYKEILTYETLDF